MNANRGSAGGAIRGPSAHVVALIGSQFHFSDRLLRLLSSEFDGPEFLRANTLEEVLDQAPSIRLVVLHEALDDLGGLIDEIGTALPGARIAVACSDVSALRLACPWDWRRRVSVLQINAELDVWLSVFRLLLCGQHYIPPELFSDLLEGNVREEAVPLRRGKAIEAMLTPRETEILPLIASGMSNKAIAGQLGLAENTVKLHTHNIFAKLGVSNRTGAAKLYLSNGGAAV